jgi:hypothetical protein
VGPSKPQLMALLKKRIDEINEVSLKMRSTAVAFAGNGMADESSVKRVGTSLRRLERELRRLQKSNETNNETNNG